VLICRWNVIKGVQWKVTRTDYAGGSFDVTFKRSFGSISKVDAQAWVDSALKHACK